MAIVLPLSLIHIFDDDKIDIGLIGKPASLKTFNFYYLDNIEDILVTTKDYLRNLSARGVKKSEILQNSTLMLLDKGNIDVYKRQAAKTAPFIICT